MGEYHCFHSKILCFTNNNNIKKNKKREKKRKKTTSTLDHLPKSRNYFTLLVPLFCFSESFLLSCCFHGPSSLHAEDLVRFGFARQGSTSILRKNLLNVLSALHNLKGSKNMKTPHTELKSHMPTLKSSVVFVLLQLKEQNNHI